MLRLSKYSCIFIQIYLLGAFNFLGGVKAESCKNSECKVPCNYYFKLKIILNILRCLLIKKGSLVAIPILIVTIYFLITCYRCFKSRQTFNQTEQQHNQESIIENNMSGVLPVYRQITIENLDNFYLFEDKRMEDLDDLPNYSQAINNLKR